MTSCGCSCGGDCKVTLLYACLEVVNTGMLADQAAQTITSDGKGLMTCLAAFGADKNVAMDGCTIACGKDYGMVKEEAASTSDFIETVALQIVRLI